ncbi:Rv3235 family protein [Actinomyces sp. ZJ308]|uniref:Rv3235 family protein n=1 Tax=Actinomyces sp. ZJ308 TaxID=2708342 RepID=UPI00142009EC|nr:Rv3235 family protein [Actinomyces sp. ZJ308]
MAVTATPTREARPARPTRRETGPQHHTHPTPTHPTPTRAVPSRPPKPINGSAAAQHHDLLRPRPRTGVDASRTAAIVVAAASEVLAGLRPVDHLARWTSPSLFEALARRAGLASRILGHEPRPRRPRIRSVRTELTMSGACEATVLLEEGNRVRAAAARLEMLRERWILTGLEIA